MDPRELLRQDGGVGCGERAHLGFTDVCRCAVTHGFLLGQQRDQRALTREFGTLGDDGKHVVGNVGRSDRREEGSTDVRGRPRGTDDDDFFGLVETKVQRSEERPSDYPTNARSIT